MSYGAGYAGNPNRGYGGVGTGYGGQQNPQLTRNKNWTEDFYTYSTFIATLAAGATSNQTIQIQADSDFEWVMSTWFAYKDGQAEPFIDGMQVPVTVLITDGGSGRQLMSGAVPISTIAGNGKQPFINPIPRKFMAKSTVNLTFTNFDAGQYDNIYFNMIGRKLFYIGP